MMFIEKKNASEFLAVKLNQIGNDVIKREYIKKYAELFDLSEEETLETMSKSKQEKKESYQKEDKIEIKTKDELLEQYPKSEVYLIALLFSAENELLDMYVDGIKEEYFTDDTVRDIFLNIKENIKGRKRLDIRELYDKLQKDQNKSHNLLESIYLLNIGDQLQNPEDLESEIASAIQRLKKTYLEKQVKESSKQLKKAEAVSDSEKAEDLQKELKALIRELSEVSS